MAIPVVCQCGQKFNARDSLAGRTVQCPKCSSPLVIQSLTHERLAADDQSETENDPLKRAPPQHEPLPPMQAPRGSSRLRLAFALGVLLVGLSIGGAFLFWPGEDVPTLGSGDDSDSGTNANNASNDPTNVPRNDTSRLPPGAAEVEASLSNLRQIVAAIKESRDANGVMPKPFSIDDSGKPLLSWRVHVLPFLPGTSDERKQYSALFERFKLNEPWDSEHNKPLASAIPDIYKTPGSSGPSEKTCYLLPHGRRTAFPGTQEVTPDRLVDGPTRTVAVMEVAEERAVVWTQPVDYKVDLSNPTNSLAIRGGYLVAFVSGEATKITKSIEPELLAALYLRDGITELYDEHPNHVALRGLQTFKVKPPKQPEPPPPQFVASVDNTPEPAPPDPPKPKPAAQPTPSKPAPQKPIRNKTGVVSSATAIADVRGDFVPNNNGHADRHGGGKWHYLASRSSNPATGGAQVVQMTWDSKYNGYEKPPGTDDGKPNWPVISRSAQALYLSPGPADGAPFPVLRWTSGFDGEVKIRGHFTIAFMNKGDGVTVYVYVDGEERFKKPMAWDNRSGVAFDFNVAVRPGSMVDFVVGQDGPGPGASFNGDGTVLSAVIEPFVNNPSTSPAPAKPPMQVAKQVAPGSQIWQSKTDDFLPYCVDASRDGRYFAAACTGPGTKNLAAGFGALIDAKTGKLVRRFVGHARGVSSVAMTVDGRRLLTGSWDNTAKVWDLETGKDLHTFKRHEWPVLTIAVSPDGKRAISASDGIRYWDIQTGELIYESRQIWATPYWSVIFAPDGNHAFAGNGNGIVEYWDLKNKKLVRKFEGPGRIKCVRVSPDGRLVVAAATDNPIVRLWSVETGKLIHELRGHKSGVSSVAFSPCGKMIVTGGGQLKSGTGIYSDTTDRSIRVWDVESGLQLTEFNPHASFITGIAFALDGKSFAFTGGDKSVRLVSAPEPPAATAKPPITRPSLLRTWSSADGKFSVEAEVLTATSSHVRLKKKDGSELTVPLANLSEPDRAYARDFVIIEKYKDLKINRPEPDKMIDERQSLDNIKEIILAQLRYEDHHKTLPPGYTTSPDGRALLSWRVHILPFLGEPGSPEQQEFKKLYEEFDLSARWNSDHNLRLVKRMPAVYQVVESFGNVGLTHYLAPRGTNTVFPGKLATTLGELRDGVSNSVAVLEVGHHRAIVWTQPADYDIKPGDLNLKRGMTAFRKGGFLIGLTDASAHKVSESISNEDLLGIFLTNDGKFWNPGFQAK